MIRKAVYDTDAEKLHHIVNSAYTVEEGDTGIAFKFGPRWLAGIENEDIKKEIQEMYVFESNDREVLGCIRSNIKDGVVTSGPFAVHLDHQGKGIGSKLLAYSETLADVSRIYLISLRNDLGQFYVKRGYKEIDRLDLYTYFDEEIEQKNLSRKDFCVIVMEKTNIKEL